MDSFYTSAQADKPHAVCIPYPGQGHINPMLKLAKLLHYKGFHITFVNTEYSHKHLTESRNSSSQDGLPDFCFEAIPDGLQSSNILDTTQDIFILWESMSKNCLGPFCDLLHKLNSASNNVPPVSCIVLDPIMQFASLAAEEFGIPTVCFSTCSAAATLCYAQLPRLVEKGLTPVTDACGSTKEHLNTIIDCIPGIKSMRYRDLPSHFRNIDPNSKMLNLVLKKMQGKWKTTAFVFNTFDSLEHEALDALSTILSPLYTIGPLHLLVDQIRVDDNLKHIASNFWIEQPECIKWLDTKAPNSVVYVNFGSVAVMTPEQLIELAWGLANSKKQFLWIIRPDLVTGGATTLPPDFVYETKDRGMLISWCPQEQVLKHPSIGGFLSHMGWNSTLESISAGVPMLCLPFRSDQQTNCRFACSEWGIGMEIEDNVVKRDQVETLVKELMEREKGVEMKAKAMEWKKKAEEASRPGGCSFQNLDKLLTDILLSDKHINHLKENKEQTLKLSSA